MTGDAAVEAADGYDRIWGRVDDVINVSGHRLGTKEIKDGGTSRPWQIPRLLMKSAQWRSNDIRREGGITSQRPATCFSILKQTCSSESRLLKGGDDHTGGC